MFYLDQISVTEPRARRQFLGDGCLNAALLSKAADLLVGWLSHGPHDPIIYEQVGAYPCLGCCRSRHLHESEARALEEERFPKVALSICPPKLNLQHSFNSVMTCKCLHCGHPSYAERSVSFSNQHFLQGKYNASQWPHLTGSLNVQNSAICSQRDCSLGL